MKYMISVMCFAQQKLSISKQSKSFLLMRYNEVNIDINSVFTNFEKLDAYKKNLLFQEIFG